MSAYAELAVTTNFSFLRGASHPDELVLQAKALKLAALGIADRNSVAGVVRAHTAAREAGFRIVVGARLVFADATPDILAYPQERAAWGRLTRLLSVGKSRADKGECTLFVDDLIEHIAGLNLIVIPPPSLRAASQELTGLLEHLRSAASCGAEQRAVAPPVWLAACMLYRGDDQRRLARLKRMAREARVPLIAVNDVLYHVPERRALQDVVTCIREHRTIAAAGRLLEANAERHLKTPAEMARLFRLVPEATAETLRFIECCRFSLDELKYDYPDETRQGYATPQEALVALAEQGARRRYPGGMRGDVRRALDHELAVTAELNYAPYFLTVYDIVRFARSKGILCQGRGSAANSVICYCLGITEVDPEQVSLLFERFVSAERREPPDIDVDFEHERREEVIQHIFNRYGRERAGLTATVICYRGRSAIREVGKVFGLSDDTVGALAGTLWGWSMEGVTGNEARRVGLDASDPHLKQVMTLADALMGFPRHLSQHVGGFVITRARLDEIVPIENAAMDERTVIEWDKDDINDLGILKIDVLGLGMLSCLRRAFDLLKAHYVCMPLPSIGPQGSSTQDVPQAGARAARAPLPPREKGRSPTPALAGVGGWGSSHGSSDPDRTVHLARFDPHPVAVTFACASAATTDLPFSRGGGDCGADRAKPQPFEGRNGRPDARETEHASQNTIPLTLAAISAGDDATYRMIQRADTIGVFQIESRAQMSMLPRLRPEKFYDLVIEVAIVRPGPIQGDMVHPYLKRRERLRLTGEAPDYPSPAPEHGDKDELKQVLEKTLGVPLFQEQAMRIAIVAAGFPPAKADRLRRAMATFKRVGTIDRFRDEFVCGMTRRGYPDDFARRCFKQIEGFGEYGFPESHAASFALLVYASAFLKCRYPDVFAAALLNSQPMGFYAPAQIVRDVKEHGVEVRPVDVNFSDWDCSLEPLHPSPFGSRTARAGGGIGTSGTVLPERRLHPRHAEMADAIRSTCALRLGLRQVSGLAQAHAQTIESVRGKGFDSVRDLWLRTRLAPSILERLAKADAFRSLGLARRDALWAVRALRRSGDKDDLPLFRRVPMDELEPDASLPPMPPGEEVIEDYRHLHLSLKAHPVSFLRGDLTRRGILPAARLAALGSGPRVTVAGLVLVRQRPGDAKAIFMTLEDETGVANAILWLRTFELCRPVVLGARLIAVTGTLQNESGVIHVVTDRVDDLSSLLRRLSEAEAPDTLLRCDEVKRPDPGVRAPKHQQQREVVRRKQEDAARDAAGVLPKGRNFH